MINVSAILKRNIKLESSLECQEEKNRIWSLKRNLKKNMVIGKKYGARKTSPTTKEDDLTEEKIATKKVRKQIKTADL